MFDCVMPTRWKTVTTWNGRVNLKNSKYTNDKMPLDENCHIRDLQQYSKGYLNHLIKSNEMRHLCLFLYTIYIFISNLCAKYEEILEWDI